MRDFFRLSWRYSYSTPKHAFSNEDSTTISWRERCFLNELSDRTPATKSDSPMLSHSKGKTMIAFLF